VSSRNDAGNGKLQLARGRLLATPRAAAYKAMRDDYSGSRSDDLYLIGSLY
jgi:hypothetical protein